MRDRDEAETNCVIAATRALVAASRAHLASLQRGAAEEQAFADVIRRELDDGRRVLTEIERRQRCGPQHR